MWTHLETFVQLFYSVGQLVALGNRFSCLWFSDAQRIFLENPGKTYNKEAK